MKNVKVDLPYLSAHSMFNTCLAEAMEVVEYTHSAEHNPRSSDKEAQMEMQ